MTGVELMISAALTGVVVGLFGWSLGQGLRSFGRESR